MHGMDFRYLSIQICEVQSNDHLQIAGETVRRVDRVLDVRQGELSWVAGTVYMDMPLKPNILDDISKDVSYHHQWFVSPPKQRRRSTG